MKPKCVTCCRREAGQQALKQAKVDYAKVDKAISQLSDDDLANVAQKSRAGRCTISRRAD